MCFLHSALRFFNFECPHFPSFYLVSHRRRPLLIALINADCKPGKNAAVTFFPIPIESIFFLHRKEKCIVTSNLWSVDTGNKNSSQTGRNLRAKARSHVRLRYTLSPPISSTSFYPSNLYLTALADVWFGKQWRIFLAEGVFMEFKANHTTSGVNEKPTRRKMVPSYSWQNLNRQKTRYWKPSDEIKLSGYIKCS